MTGDVYKFPGLRQAVQEYYADKKLEMIEYKGGTQVIWKTPF
jgi:hypothetical protein